MSYQDFDFMGFTYNGKHSYRDLGIYRVSNGDRYEETFTPAFQEKTASVDGMIGQYYFGQNIQSRQFNISFAFDRLTESGVRLLKQTFNGDGIHDLIFDEHPYKVYSAKVTGSATMKTICFELDEGRVYRGEGIITFTCYYPYAHTPKTILDNNEDSRPTKVNTTITYKTITEGGTTKSQLIDTPTHLDFLCGIAVDGGNWNFTVPRTNKSLAYDITITYYQDGKKKVKKAELGNYTSDYTLGFGDKKAYIERIEYNLLGKIEGIINPLTFNDVFEMYNNTIRYINSVMHGDDQCYRRANTSKIMQKPNPKITNDYSAFYYPTKREWYEASGLPLHSAPTTNVGDLPATFKVLYQPGAQDTYVTFNVGEAEVTVTGIDTNKYSNMTWDSKLGIISAKINGVGDPKVIPCTGNPYTSIPVGGSTIPGKSAGTGSLSIEYDLWYY